MIQNDKLLLEIETKPNICIIIVTNVNCKVLNFKGRKLTFWLK